VSSPAELHESFMALLESDEVFYLVPVFANMWSQLGKDAPGEAAGDRSGTSLAISSDGSRLAVGAPGNSDGDYGLYDIGHVRVYHWSGSDWVQLGDDIDGRSENDRFGGTVSFLIAAIGWQLVPLEPMETANDQARSRSIHGPMTHGSHLVKRSMAKPAMIMLEPPYRSLAMASGWLLEQTAIAGVAITLVTCGSTNGMATAGGSLDWT
jgi:hypothetical protein